MGNSRRFHTKTRNGCTNCKKRRVKVCFDVSQAWLKMGKMLTMDSAICKLPSATTANEEEKSAAFNLEITMKTTTTTKIKIVTKRRLARLTVYR